MNIEARINALELAHRALHARHEGLMMVCRVMLPLINVHLSLKQRMSITAYDAMAEHMSKRGFDSDFQQKTQAAVEELTAVILIGA